MYGEALAILQAHMKHSVASFRFSAELFSAYPDPQAHVSNAIHALLDAAFGRAEVDAMGEHTRELLYFGVCSLALITILLVLRPILVATWPAFASVKPAHKQVYALMNVVKATVLGLQASLRSWRRRPNRSARARRIVPRAVPAGSSAPSPASAPDPRARQPARVPARRRRRCRGGGTRRRSTAATSTRSASTTRATGRWTWGTTPTSSRFRCSIPRPMLSRC